MGAIRPKETLQKARLHEQKGEREAAASEYLLLGLFFCQRGKFQEACQVFEHGIGLHADLPRLHLELAFSRHRLGNDAGAREVLEKAARVALRAKRLEKAVEAIDRKLEDAPALRAVFFEAVLRVERTQGWIFLKLAQAFLAASEVGQAKKALVDGLHASGSRDAILVQIEELLIASGELSTLEHLKRFRQGTLVLEDFAVLMGSRNQAPGENDLAPSHDAGEGDRDLHTLIRELEIEIGSHLGDARDSVGELVREFRDRADTVLGDDGKARIDMATAFFEMGLWTDAKEELLKLGFSDPCYLEAQHLLARIHEGEGMDLAALEIYQRCLREERASLTLKRETRYHLAELYFRLGDCVKSLEMILLLEEEAPDYRDLRTLKRHVQQAASKPGRGF